VRVGKLKPVLFLGSAVIVALITSLLVYSMLQKGKTKEKPALKTQQIAVATGDLTWGTVLERNSIKMVPYLKDSVPEGSFSDISSVAGRVLISPIKATEPILESRLAPNSIKTGGVAAVISPKKRAIAVRIDKTIGVSGFIRPGNRVDVLVTLPSGKIPAPLTKTVLENVLVKTVGPDIEKKGKDEKASEADVITLEVTPDEAEKLALAVTEGKIQLTLRNYTDTADVITKGVTIPILLASYSSGIETRAQIAKGRGGGKRQMAPRMLEPVKAKSELRPPAPVPEKKPEPKPQIKVELIKGSTVTVAAFEKSEEK
jgi:pilus assembly protein CpaB